MAFGRLPLTGPNPVVSRTARVAFARTQGFRVPGKLPFSRLIGFVISFNNSMMNVDSNVISSSNPRLTRHL